MLSCYPGFWASAAWVLWCYCIMSALMLRNFTWAGYNLRLCDICENNVPALLQMVNSLLNYDSLESSRVCQTNGLLFFEYKSGGISPPSTRESWALFWESSRKSLLEMGLCLSVCLTYYVSIRVQELHLLKSFGYKVCHTVGESWKHAESSNEQEIIQMRWNSNLLGPHMNFFSSKSCCSSYNTSTT